MFIYVLTSLTITANNNNCYYYYKKKNNTITNNVSSIFTLNSGVSFCHTSVWMNANEKTRVFMELYDL